jgi:hypothetical protein
MDPGMDSYREFLDTSSNEGAVRGFLHRPSGSATDGLILTHGAGVNCDAPLLRALAGAFCASGLAVLRCDLPFRQSHPHGPPPRGSAERDQQGLRAAVASMRQQVTGRVFLGGHSYGGRQASMLAAAEPGLIDALLLLSYPLHPPKRRDELRTGHFPQLQTPVLCVHGTRDGFGALAEMEAALALIPARKELLAIPSAGHELMTKANQDELPAIVVARFCAFADLRTE